MIQVHSFDVFDTCLTRRSALPSRVFYETARNALAKRGLDSGHFHIEDFFATRLEAEDRARSASGREDISLTDIWQVFTGLIGWPYDPSLLQCELEAEDALLVPIYAMQQRVQKSRESGQRIVFISDMYLPGDFIRQQLVKHGFAQPCDPIYVSSDIGKTKRSGNLFKHMLAQEKIEPGHVLHTGDNPHADVHVARSLGMQAELFEPSAMTAAERNLFRTSYHSPEVERVIGAIRAFRLGQTPDDPDMNEVISQFVAPFVMGFAVWVLQMAQKAGIKRLYFMSRDCQLTWKIACELAPRFGDIECRYLYTSRQTLFLASAQAVSLEKMPWMRKEFEDPILTTLLGKIDLVYEDVEPYLADMAGSRRGSYLLASEADWDCFWKALNEKSVRARINEAAEMRRETTRQYFEAEGLFDEIPWAIVDVGWYLTCQKSLVELLRSWNHPRPVLGYYLGLRNQRVGQAEADHTDALFYEKPGDFPFPEESNGLYFYIILLEHIVGCADHPTVHHYERKNGKAGPAFATTVDEKTMKFCRKLHAGVLDFVIKNPRLVDDFRHPNLTRDLLLALINNFFKTPTSSQVRAVMELTSAIDQTGVTNPIPIAKPLTYKTALLPILPKRNPRFASLWKQTDCFWPEGSFAITPTPIQQFSLFVQASVKTAAKVVRLLRRR